MMMKLIMGSIKLARIKHLKLYIFLFLLFPNLPPLKNCRSRQLPISPIPKADTDEAPSLANEGASSVSALGIGDIGSCLERQFFKGGKFGNNKNKNIYNFKCFILANFILPIISFIIILTLYEELAIFHVAWNSFFLV